MLKPISFSQVKKYELIPQAILRKPISYFFPISNGYVVQEQDDLDAYEGLAFVLNGDLNFALKHYRGYPKGTTTICLPKEIQDIPAITKIIARIVHELDLPTEIIQWQRRDNPEL
jgi:hypothetical protein